MYSGSNVLQDFEQTAAIAYNEGRHSCWTCADYKEHAEHLIYHYS